MKTIQAVILDTKFHALTVTNIYQAEFQYNTYILSYPKVLRYMTLYNDPRIHAESGDRSLAGGGLDPYAGYRPQLTPPRPAGRRAGH